MSAHDQAAARTPELVKLAARAMLNDPESVSGELVRAWKALKAENERLREQVNSGRLGRERAEGLPEGTLPRV